MSPVTLEINLGQNVPELVARLAPARMLAAVAGAMDLATQQTAADIQEERLSGEGPFPPSEGRLGVRSGRLRQSVRTTPATIEGTQVTTALGTNVVYAAIHEFGGTITRTTKPGKVRLRTDAGGNLLKRGNLATFARASHKRAREVGYAGGKTLTITMPARAPFGHGVADHQALFRLAIGRALTEAIGGGAP